MKIFAIRLMGLVTIILALVFTTLPTQLIISATNPMPTPHAFYGSLYHSDGSPASIGVIVSARVNGVAGGSIATTTAGKYGDAYKGNPKLNVEGYFEDGYVITFYVNGVQATPSYPDGEGELPPRFKSGELTHLDLTYTPPTQYFYGTITTSTGEPAPAGVNVSAKIRDMVYASLVTSEAGKFGGPGTDDPRLMIQADIADGEMVNFYINNIPASPAVVFAKGKSTEVNLIYTIPTPTPTPTVSPTPKPPVNGGGGGNGTTSASTTSASTTTTTTTPASTYLRINVDGSKSIIPISSTGIIEQSLTVASHDGDIQLNIPAGTRITIASGGLTDITIEPLDNPPAPPSNKNYISKIYVCEPSSAVFNPEVKLIMRFNAPPGLDLTAFYVGFYSKNNWAMLNPSQYYVDLRSDTAVIAISHFSYYAIFAKTGLTSTTRSTTQTSSQFTTTSTATNATDSGLRAYWWFIIGAILVILIVIVGVLARKRN